MKCIGLMLVAAAVALVPRSSAAAPCSAVSVKANVEMERGELTLADLLRADACPQIHQAAAQVALGIAPRPGSARVLDGRQVWGWIGTLAASLEQNLSAEIPERIVVRRGGAGKSCAEIAGFVVRHSSQDRDSTSSLGNFDCAAARSIPQNAALELVRSAWNPALRRWEFALRCTAPQACVPFLVWAGEPTPRKAAELTRVALGPADLGYGEQRLVKPGQTATLRWDEGGIRIVLPVTCLDSGGLGQMVRVRFKNAAGILRAEVLSDGTLLAGL
jgi:Chaperone for flagella basal body P-ring formation